ncbi:MAG: hypothetical protein AAGL49_15185, partial [Pseudomonadota bacterium]
MRVRIRNRWALLAGVSLSAAALAGCGGEGGGEPQLFGFDYQVQADSQALSDAIGQVKDGARAVESLYEMGEPVCTLLSDARSPTAPAIAINGQPGDPGANLAIFSAGPANFSDANACAGSTASEVGEIQIFLGCLGLFVDHQGRAEED